MSSNCDSLYIQAFVIENSHNQVRQRYRFEFEKKYMQIPQFHIVVNTYHGVAVMGMGMGKGNCQVCYYLSMLMGMGVGVLGGEGGGDPSVLVKSVQRIYNSHSTFK